jgi:hypothetical protein
MSRESGSERPLPSAASAEKPAPVNSTASPLAITAVSSRTRSAWAMLWLICTAYAGVAFRSGRIPFVHKDIDGTRDFVRVRGTARSRVRFAVLYERNYHLGHALPRHI